MLELYKYFDEESEIYTEENIETMPDIFDDVIAFEISNLGAMGGAGLLLLMTKKGESYPVSFLKVEESEQRCTFKKSKAFDYVDKKMNGMLSKLLTPRMRTEKDENGRWQYEPLKHGDGWNAVEDGMGWHICAKNEYFDKLSKKEFLGNDFATTKLIKSFPSHIWKMLNVNS